MHYVQLLFLAAVGTAFAATAIIITLRDAQARRRKAKAAFFKES